MSKREINDTKEDEYDPLISRCLKQLAKLKEESNEKHKLKEERIQRDLIQLKHQLDISNEEMELVIDEFDEYFLKRISITGDKEEKLYIVLFLEYEHPLRNKVFKILGDGLNTAHQNDSYNDGPAYMKVKKASIQLLRERIISAWNTRHPKLFAELLHTSARVPFYLSKEDTFSIMSITYKLPDQ